ncbi:MAG TPA: hypothetical protein VI056_01170 [Candidatus Limnocylindria bacterium]
MNAQPGGNRRSTDHWAATVRTLNVGAVAEGALNANVQGRRPSGALQGFGQLWQKTFRTRLHDADLGPADVIRVWKAEFSTFWPRGLGVPRMFAPLTGIAPGEVGVINIDVPGGVVLSTGVLVIYADDESFTFMTPEGHMFAGWITFNAAQENADILLQIQVLIRAYDPLTELAMMFGGGRREERFWERTLQAVAGRFGLPDAVVESEISRVDGRRQWSRVGNIFRSSNFRPRVRWLRNTRRS